MNPRITLAPCRGEHYPALTAYQLTGEQAEFSRPPSDWLSGNILIYEPDVSDEPKRLQLGYRPRKFRTGWLDRYLVVGGDRHLSIHPFDNLEERIQLDFGYDEDVTDMWISGDSKLVLYSKEYKPVLSRYNLQTQESLPDIRLNGIVQADWIRMGSTNNVCY